MPYLFPFGADSRSICNKLTKALRARSMAWSGVTCVTCFRYCNKWADFDIGKFAHQHLPKLVNDAIPPISHQQLKSLKYSGGLRKGRNSKHKCLWGGNLMGKHKRVPKTGTQNSAHNAPEKRWELILSRPIKLWIRDLYRSYAPSGPSLFGIILISGD
jgi:hypothetical protein